MDKKKIFFDIETVVETTDYENYPKKDIRSERYCNDIGSLTEKQAYLEKASIHPEFSKIICISVGLAGDVVSFYGNETDVLNDFFAYLDRQGEYILVGHNIKSFDIPFVFRRAIINGIKPHPSFILGNKKPREIEHIDTIEIRKQTGFIGTGLDLICRCLNITSPKIDMSGKDVHRVYYESLGKKDSDGAIDTSGIERIAKYCEADVAATMKFYEKIEFIMGGEAQAPSQQSTSSDMITEKQVKYILVLRGDLKLGDKSEELRKGYMKKIFNVESTKDLTKDQASDFISKIKTEQSKIVLNEHGSKEEDDDDLPF